MLLYKHVKGTGDDQILKRVGQCRSDCTFPSNLVTCPKIKKGIFTKLFFFKFSFFI